MISKVHTWKMTEEERLAYIEKHPIIPTEKPKGSSYSGVYDIPAYRKKQEERRLRGIENSKK
ncbi:hypothetical protein [Metabacillus sp. B2-18]|uniref:hypothetical protein n=1 Tax=Metabacillus sp. B2-18 TaxID=2897333 RepID=UPI001E627F79|nr:hypothetical protein [Metabacillus sp. B2-18]UGB31693.1 hypothetical protein LPC09_04215 [Metabacillus sp. B2-18]